MMIWKNKNPQTDFQRWRSKGDVYVDGVFLKKAENSWDEQEKRFLPFFLGEKKKKANDFYSSRYISQTFSKLRS